MKIHDFHLEPNIEYQKKYDCVISSNVIEHSPNPIHLILNFSKLITIDGWHFHAIPNAKHCFDKYRKITTIKHMVNDYMNGTDFSDETHLEEYFDSAVLKDGYQKKFHETYPVSYPYIHQHTFDPENVYELIG